MQTVTGRPSSRGTRPLAIAALTALALVLTACVPFLPLPESGTKGPLAIRFDTGVLELAVCEAIIVEEMWIDVQEPGGRYEEVFAATSPLGPIERGAVISTAEPPPTFSVATNRDIQLVPGSAVQASIGGEDALAGAWLISAEWLERGGWLSTRGAITQEPCAPG